MWPIKSSVALAIASLDRTKFNLIVHSGHFPCAPATDERFPRMFYENDVVVLVVLGKLIAAGVLPRFAGHWACDLRKILDHAPKFNGKQAFRLDDDGKGRIVPEGESLVVPPVAVIVIDVGAVREHIAREIKRIGAD